MARYLFNVVDADAATGTPLRELTAGFLRVRMWGVEADEPHRNALAAGDLVLLVRITANEYETALAVAAGHAPSTG